MLGLLSAGISGVGAIAGGLMGRSAANRAAQEQRGGYNAALSAIGEGNSDAAGILRPYSDEGAGARSLRNAALGVPTGQGGISQSGIADEGAVAKQLLEGNPDFRNGLIAETQNRKSKLYGMSLEQGVQYWLDNLGGSSSPAYLDAQEKVKAQQTGSGQAPMTQQDASDVFQGTQYAKDAANYSNALWQPIGGERATFEQSPWKAMTDRATTKTNDLFLGLAGAQGNLLSGNTARGLQENTANINDSMYGDYLNAYNGAAQGQYGANTNAFDKWMSGLGGVADTGYAADQTVAGNAVNQGAQVANLATGNGQAQAQGVINKSNATQNMIGGVFNALGQGVQALSTPATTATTQPPRTNSLYLAANHNKPTAGQAGYFNLR